MNVKSLKFPPLVHLNSTQIKNNKLKKKKNQDNP